MTADTSSVCLMVWLQMGVYFYSMSIPSKFLSFHMFSLVERVHGNWK